MNVLQINNITTKKEGDKGIKIMISESYYTLFSKTI
jgi:hypothetical protein